MHTCFQSDAHWTFDSGDATDVYVKIKRHRVRDKANIEPCVMVGAERNCQNLKNLQNLIEHFFSFFRF